MTSLRILHVDDEPDIREVVELSLGLDPAFSVRSVDSGRAALAAVAEWTPDLILCDVMMPVMDGPTTLARLRAQPGTARIPVVFMTARAQSREIEQFKALGAAGVIPKPFDPMTLATAVRSQLRSAGIGALRDGFLRAPARRRGGARAMPRDARRQPGSSTALDRHRAISRTRSRARPAYSASTTSASRRRTLEKAALSPARGRCGAGSGRAGARGIACRHADAVGKPGLMLSVHDR